MKKGIKDIIAPQGMFEDLGIKYLGPVDGHDISALERALEQAKQFGAPVIVHAITEKGRGHTPAEQNEADKFHSVGVIDPETGEPVNPASTSWTSVFSSELIEIARKREDIVALTAAMLGPTGLDKFKQSFHPAQLMLVSPSSMPPQVRPEWHLPVCTLWLRFTQHF